VHPGTNRELPAPLLEEVSGSARTRLHSPTPPHRPRQRDFTRQHPKVIAAHPACNESAAPSTAVSPTRWYARVACAKRKPCSYWRQLRHVNIALVNEMAVLCTTWASTSGTSSAARRPSRSATRPSAGPARHAVPQDLTGHGPACAWSNWPSRSQPDAPYVIQRAATLLNEHGNPRAEHGVAARRHLQGDLADQQGTPQEIRDPPDGTRCSVSYHDRTSVLEVLDARPRADSLYEARADAD